MRLFWKTLLFCTLLSGCASQPGVFEQYGDRWYFSETMPVCSGYEWVQRDPIDVQRICQASDAFHQYVIGCAAVANACLIISMYDEATADKVFILGSIISHRYHERDMHLFRRLRHP